MTTRKLIYANLLSLAFAFCGTPGAFADSLVVPPDSAPQVRDYYPVVSFLYGTDRGFDKGRFNSNNSPDLAFGEAQMVLHLHYLRQGVPACNWWHMRKPGDQPTGLRKPHSLDPAAFALSLNSNAKDGTFVYVHGFATTFDEGAKEAAQIAYDLQLPGTPLLYSWPSHGNVSFGDYDIDQKTVNRPESISHLTAFLVGVLENSSQGQIHLVGFSMGTYLLTRALMEMVDQGRDLSKIGAVILISADIDSQDFRTLYYPKLKKALAGRLVLYVSGRDQALVLSETFHHHRSRLGQGGQKITTLEGVTTIDATQSSLDCGICHGLSQINGVINDMYLSLRQGLPPDRRLLDSYEKNGEAYYVLFDDSHDIAHIEDRNFAIAGQLGTYLNTLKLVWLPHPALEIAAGVDRGFLPEELELRWNLEVKNFRPYVNAGLDYFDQGSGETAWATNEGLGVEYAFDSGPGLSLEWDWISPFSRSSLVPGGSALDGLLKNNGCPWSGFHIQFIQYFDFNKLLD
jgi:pimeloyl-ACP methyl ester carboxylesterase